MHHVGLWQQQQPWEAATLAEAGQAPAQPRPTPPPHKRACRLPSPCASSQSIVAALAACVSNPSRASPAPLLLLTATPSEV